MDNKLLKIAVWASGILLLIMILLWIWVALTT